ncbi:MAG: Ig-like domain-containing protein [Candidatus Dojkabacteria bacterium]|nr:Ig-like domain-containing protein [Candidatus Dojkabacteria bacterium]
MAQQNNSDTRAKRSDENSTASEQAARVFGVLFILIGLVLVAVLIGGFIISRLPYRVDPNLPIPTLDSVEPFTGEDTITVRGAVLPGETVALYIDDERYSDTVETNEDGEFEFIDLELEEEGDIAFETAVVRGGLFKRRSELSNEVITTVDWTAPSPEIALEYNENADASTTNISGTTEPNATIIVQGPADQYEATADEEGNFTVSDIALIEGSNEFTVRVRDQAGNEVLAQEKAIIAFAGAGAINGDGATDSRSPESLPESAGELERAMEILAGNKLMAFIALTAIAAFAGSSSVVYRLSKKQG